MRTTISDVLAQGEKKLNKAGIADADWDAWCLFEYVTGISRAVYLCDKGRLCQEEHIKRYQELIERRMLHIPLQYLIGEQVFMGLPFLVNPNVLIPRQDTEILVEEVQKRLKPGMTILDMCTGSGCILLSLMHTCEIKRAVGADLSPEALEVAKKNEERLCKDGFLKGIEWGKRKEEKRETEKKEIGNDIIGNDIIGNYVIKEENKEKRTETRTEREIEGAEIKETETKETEIKEIETKETEIKEIKIKETDIKGTERTKETKIEKIEWICTNMFDQIEEKFDCIVSNPPYIATAVIETLAEEVKKYEPYLALDGREDGLYFYRILAKEAKDCLNPGGMLFLEIGYDQGETISALLIQQGFSQVQIKKDLAGLDRVCFGILE